MAREQRTSPDGDQRTPLIVVGVHGTSASDAALEWAVREARLRQARLHLVLADDPTAYRLAPYAPPTAPAGRGADGPIAGHDGVDADWLTGVAISVTLVLPPGRVSAELVGDLPAQALADRAANASLLVIGSGSDSDYLGPVARACLRLAPCPVVILAPDAIRPAPIPRPRPSAEPASV